MENLAVAQSFFLAHLPKKLIQTIDWSTLTIADSARRIPGRKSLQTDITHHCLTKESSGHIYLHVEQERKVDHAILGRNFAYNAGLYYKHRKQGHKKLPLIVNILLYNGTRANFLMLRIFMRTLNVLIWQGWC